MVLLHSENETVSINGSLDGVGRSRKSMASHITGAMVYRFLLHPPSQELIALLGQTC